MFNLGLAVFAGVLAGLAILFIFMAVKPVHQGMQYTVERFGKYTRTLEPGLNFVTPFIDRIGRKISMMEEVMDIPSQEVITRDNAMVRVDGVVYYQIVNAARAAYEISNLPMAIENLSLTNIRTVMGSMDLDESLSRRDEINQQLLKVIDDATDPWGVKVLRVEIKDIAPPEDLVNAMASQMKAEREKRASITIAEGSKEAEIRKAEGERNAMILEAEGRQRAAELDAQARIALAKAEAESTRVLSEAIAAGNVQAINYFVAQKYVEALGKIASADNQKLVLMPLEASSVIGALGGISEIAKEAFKVK